MPISLDVGMLLMILAFFLIQTLKMHRCTSNIMIIALHPRDYEIIVLNRHWEGALCLILLQRPIDLLSIIVVVVVAVVLATLLS